MENAYQETMFLLKKYHINANKKLGQNFLINDDVIQQTIEAAKITKGDLILEIGPRFRNTNQALTRKSQKSN